MFHDGSRPAQQHPCSQHVLFTGMLPGRLATRCGPSPWPWGARGAGSEPGTGAEPVPSGPTRSVRRPFVAGAELQSVPAQAGACCLHSPPGGGSDSRCFDAEGAVGRAAAQGPRGWGHLELLRGWGLCCRQHPVKRSHGCWPHTAHPARLIPHGSSRTAHRTQLIPHGSSHTAHPAQLAPHISSPTVHPARLALHARCRPRARGVGSGAGRESGKQETGSVEHRSRATRNRALAKNSSRAAPGAGQLPFGREGALPPPADPLGHGPHAHRELPGELPGQPWSGTCHPGRGAQEGPGVGRRAEQTLHGTKATRSRGLRCLPARDGEGSRAQPAPVPATSHACSGVWALPAFPWITHGAGVTGTPSHHGLGSQSPSAARSVISGQQHG